MVDPDKLASEEASLSRSALLMAVHRLTNWKSDIHIVQTTLQALSVYL